MAECKTSSVVVNPDLVCQSRKDKACDLRDCCESNQESVLDRFERILNSVSACAEAYTHRDVPVLISGGSYILIRSEPDR
jgi:hypothetical protein